jgi:hypothetical protein
MQATGHTLSLTETGTREEHGPRHGEAQVPASLRNIATQSFMPEANAGAGLSDRVTETTRAKKDSSEPRRPAIHANWQSEDESWSQEGESKSAQGHEWPRVSESGTYMWAAMRWPSLPEELTTDTQDWEMAWRTWERQQRLDKEQRGSSWNA